MTGWGQNQFRKIFTFHLKNRLLNLESALLAGKTTGNRLFVND
ncbi:hypothetical protein HMPREF9135_2209 [Segatella baroniae F0067]|uniref:Uncharacterized protein n=1 Tax=Segatella baroniae F0067 TaxID=1115809 RepID=U2QEF7_9BACT|nr:hypothetical protein HMPREF9135_2209 [Segatella baroniae F0067]